MFALILLNVDTTGTSSHFCSCNSYAQNGIYYLISFILLLICAVIFIVYYYKHKRYQLKIFNEGLIQYLAVYGKDELGKSNKMPAEVEIGSVKIGNSYNSSPSLNQYLIIYANIIGLSNSSVPIIKALNQIETLSDSIQNLTMTV